MLACAGALNGFGNVLTITAMQRWAPAATIGRVLGFVMLGSFGIFPISVLLGGIVVRNLGAAAFFPLAAAMTAVAVGAALLSPEWRNFGAGPTVQRVGEIPPEPTPSTT